MYKPNLYIFGQDETHYWREDIAEEAGKIIAFYLVDMNVVTHLCSFTPSYWAGLITYNTQNDVSEDTWNNILGELQAIDPWDYYSNLPGEDKMYKCVDEKVAGATFDSVDSPEIQAWMSKAARWYSQNDVFQLEIMKKMGVRDE